jgi:hypothetical protein
MTDKQAPDWERIEQLYRADLLSLREIAAACPGSNHTAIARRAKKFGWAKNLSVKIKAKADDLVTRQAVTETVTDAVTAKRAVSDRQIIEVNAQVIADVRLAHRTDIGRSRRLANKLLEELEAMTDDNGTLRELIDQLKDDEGPASLLEAAQKMASLPGRSKIIKELSETLKNLITLERQAYDLGNAGESDPGDTPTRIELVAL